MNFPSRLLVVIRIRISGYNISVSLQQLREASLDLSSFVLFQSSLYCRYTDQFSTKIEVLNGESLQNDFLEKIPVLTTLILLRRERSLRLFPSVKRFATLCTNIRLILGRLLIFDILCDVFCNCQSQIYTNSHFDSHDFPKLFYDMRVFADNKSYVEYSHIPCKIFLHVIWEYSM